MRPAAPFAPNRLPLCPVSRGAPLPKPSSQPKLGSSSAPYSLPSPPHHHHPSRAAAAADVETSPTSLCTCSVASPKFSGHADPSDDRRADSVDPQGRCTRAARALLPAPTMVRLVGTASAAANASPPRRVWPVEPPRKVHTAVKVGTNAASLRYSAWPRKRVPPAQPQPPLLPSRVTTTASIAGGGGGHGRGKVSLNSSSHPKITFLPLLCALPLESRQLLNLPLFEFRIQATRIQARSTPVECAQ